MVGATYITLGLFGESVGCVTRGSIVVLARVEWG
jgi:hypothetical protein